MEVQYLTIPLKIEITTEYQKKGDIFNRIFFISIHLHKSGFVALIGLGELE